MSYKYIYDPIALTEYKDAVSWYNARSKKAAEIFVIEVTKKIGQICSNPFRNRNEYKSFKEISLKKYPYCIVYFVDENTKTVVITSVYHHKRNPTNKYEK